MAKLIKVTYLLFTRKTLPTVMFALVMLLLYNNATYAQRRSVDVVHYGIEIWVNDANNAIAGKTEVTLIKKDSSSTVALQLVQLKENGTGMHVTATTVNGQRCEYTQRHDSVIVQTGEAGRQPLHITIGYTGVPADGLIIGRDKYAGRTFFADNWPDRAHHWFACVDRPDDKAMVDMAIHAPEHYTVVANGLKVNEEVQQGVRVTRWHSESPLPTKVIVFGAARFKIDTVRSNKAPAIYSYVFENDSKVGFKAYKYAPAIMDFYEQRIGPFAYEKLANIQSKTRFGGMENAGAIFYYEHSTHAPDIELLMAHEIAHQWFGDAVTEKSFKHVWLSEGFATYATDCYVEYKYGADSLKRLLQQQRDKVIGFEQQRFTPVLDTAPAGRLTELLNANSYEKGAWVLHMLRNEVGDNNFWALMQKYYSHYKHGTATTADFEEVAAVVGKDLPAGFFRQWLTQPGHPKITVHWKYNKAAGMVRLGVMQAKPFFNVPVEIAVDSQIIKVQLSGAAPKATLHVAHEPGTVVADPNIRLLAEFKIVKD